MKNFIIVFAISFFLFACEEADIRLDSTVPSEEVVLESDLLQTNSNQHNSGQSGAIITRRDDLLGTLFGAIIYSDEKTGLTAIHGYDVMAFCAGEPDFFDLTPLKEIILPNDPDRISIVQQGEVTTYVYEGIWDFTTTPLCEFLTTAPVLAQGTAKMVYTDNDVLTFERDSKNYNTYGLSAHGELISPTGEKRKFSGQWRGVWDGDGDNPLFFRELYKVQLK